MPDYPPYLLCATCEFGAMRMPMRYWHLMALHAALDHGVNLRDIYRSKRIQAPSSTVTWRLENGTGWAIERTDQPIRQG